MREIKFRGFSEQQNKWIYGGYHKPFEDITQIIENVKNNASQMSIIKNGTEGQFTGLKDKNTPNKNCIYEGDVLSLEGIVIGNIYENKEMVKEKTNIIIGNVCSREWRDTEKKAMERGCSYS